MASQIDPSLPVAGTPTTQSVRSNFAIAAAEIGTLQTQILASPITINAGPAAIIPDGTARVYVTTTAALTLTLPHNDCLVMDRSGNRTNPITVAPPAGATINGAAQFAIVNSWQHVMFLWDGAAFGVLG